MEQLEKYAMNEEQFERFRKLINQASGIFLDRGKWDFLGRGLADRARATGVDSIAEYYELLTSEPERECELRRLLDRLSVQETQFFRNLPQYDALRKYIIPEIAGRKAGRHRSIRLWSAGCSTGQEPYSLAFSLLDVIPGIDSWNIRIMGTDLSERALETAAEGWYPEKKLTGLDRRYVEKYMSPRGGGYMVNDEVKRLVEFRCLNLVTDPLPIEAIGTCDVVFCRNVIIYFTHETARFVVEHFFDILNPGGYLFLGHSETLWKMSSKYSLVEIGDAFIYKKSLPRGINGRRFINDRRMRPGTLPAGVSEDRRKIDARRTTVETTATEDFVYSAAEPGHAGDYVEEISESTPAQAVMKLLKLGEYEKAVIALNEILEVESNEARTHFLMGLAQEKLEHYEEAASSFRKTVYCDDKYSIAYFHLASVLEHLGELKTAMKEYRNAVELLRRDEPGRWEMELSDYGVESLVDLCEWKIENLGAL